MFILGRVFTTPRLLGRDFVSRRGYSTVYALSTKFSRAAIGVVRVSGPHSKYIYQKLTNTTPPPPRMASVRKLYSSNGALLDEALTLFFRGPNSYTGEDLVEFHLHGGTAIIQGVMKAIAQLHDPEKNKLIRAAEAGEFSRRAFANGRFDLTEIEGIREMIDAETESQRVAALSSMTGQTKQLFGSWRQQLLNNVALLTTVIDFGEDHDIEEVSQLFETVETNMDALAHEIETYLNRVQALEVLMRGIKLILLGPPNAGKSSLLNYLANKDAAIVSNIAGTTRDTIDVPLDIGGFKVVVGDTAGVRDLTGGHSDTIEAEGIKRAKAKALLGDLVLVIVPANEPKIDLELVEHIEMLKEANKEIVVVVNKQDLVDGDVIDEISQNLNLPKESFKYVSCLTGFGMDDLQDSFTDIFRRISMTENEDPIVISERAQDLLKNDVLYGISQFKTWKNDDDVVLATESLRQSVEGIGKITGDAIGVEEILGVVFSSFCIGK